jgi:hypothetical protein
MRAIVLIVTLFAVTGNGQTWPQIRKDQQPEYPPDSISRPNEIPSKKGDPVARRMEQERLRQANKERQARLKEDTDKLLKLANELKASVDRTNENVLSLDVIKKAEEIEKLAKSVKDRMKQEHVSQFSD